MRFKLLKQTPSLQKCLFQAEEEDEDDDLPRKDEL